MDLEHITMEELSAEAKRRGYKLMPVSSRPRFERCLCGHNVHQWQYQKGQTRVVCKMCGMAGPWVQGKDPKVIEGWNRMISAKRSGNQ